MWQRSTWHECAGELAQVSRRFRDAYWGREHGSHFPRHPADEAEMKETSIVGVQILRALALAVRSEQDFGLIPPALDVVGVFKRKNAVPDDAVMLKQGGGYKSLLGRDGYSPLKLRQALNKIAHSNPKKGDFYVGPGDLHHDILLFGDDHGQDWFAAISILELITSVRALPDASIKNECEIERHETPQD
jgi:hypothetical protein